MSELNKTFIYLGVALLAVLTAFLSRPRQVVYEPPERVGQPLFPEMEDPSAAASLEIVEFDEGLGAISDFKVARDKNSGRWVIPSHSNYPADAEQRMRDAVTGFIGLEVLDVASEVPEDHAKFGVVEPDREKIEASQEGVGTLVTVENKDGSGLVDLIIGKKVKDQEGLRFVRKRGEPLVYVVKVDPEKLSTKFQDWIEAGLLKLDSFDVEKLRFLDYSFLPTADGRYAADFRMDVGVQWNSQDFKWELDKFLTYTKDPANPGRTKETPTDLLATEELNKQKLDEVKDSLRDLKIVGVRRKPEGLGADLKAGGDFINDQEDLNSLYSRGFYPLRSADGQFELKSANGELYVTSKDGVEYVLRFGGIAGSESEAEQEKLTRYLFVTARVDESKFPRPEREAYPDEKPGSDPPPAPTSASDDTTGAACGDETSDDDAPAESAPAEGEKTEQDEKGAQDQPAEPARPNEPKQSEKGSEAEPAKTEETEKKDAPDTQPAAETEKTDPGDKPEASETPKPDAEKSELQSERDRIDREYQRKLDEWTDNRKQAADKVADLNARFADWYYVISDDEYKKIHLSRADIIKERDTAKEEGFGVDAFRSLEKEGLKKEDGTANP